MSQCLVLDEYHLLFDGVGTDMVAMAESTQGLPSKRVGPKGQLMKASEGPRTPDGYTHCF